MKIDRWCGYCGKSSCKCQYRAGRSGLTSVTMSNISAQTTKAEMLKAINGYFQNNLNEKGFYSVSFTGQDEAKVSKIRSKALEEVSK